MTPQTNNLTSKQCKALRRLSRSQSINASMWDDPIISQCIDASHYIEPPNLRELPAREAITAWCDWEAKARWVNRPRINSHGKKLLKELEMQE